MIRQFRKAFFFLALCAIFTTRDTFGQFTTIINVPPNVAPSTIGSDTQLNLFDGGEIGFGSVAGSFNDPNTNIELNIAGGSVGDLFSAIGTTVNISGGTVGLDFSAYEGSTVNVTGGSVDGVTSYRGSKVNVSGGLVGIDASDGSTVNISGGSLSWVQASGRNTLNIFGSEFRFNGVLIDGLGSIGSKLPFNVPGRSLLSGTLADGTPFSLYNQTILDGALMFHAAALPPIGLETITLPSNPAPLGIRTGQTLIVNRGAVVAPSFNAGLGSRMRIEGGQVGRGLNAVGAQVTISSGVVGRRFNALNGSEVEISGGSIRSIFATRSIINISGGSVGDYSRVYYGGSLSISGGSVANNFSIGFGEGISAAISGGSVGDRFSVYGKSTVDISGGSIGDYFSLYDGSTANIFGGSIGDQILANPGSTINLFGTKFMINGMDISASLPPNIPLTITGRNVTLSGRLADGSQFSFDLNNTIVSGKDYFAPGVLVTVTSIPEPTSLALSVTIMGLGLLKMRRS